jgi:hypothetical protein
VFVAVLRRRGRAGETPYLDCYVALRGAFNDAEVDARRDRSLAAVIHQAMNEIG